jgi:hypothetical protein
MRAVLRAGNFLEPSRLNPPPAFVPRSEFREYRPRVRMWPPVSSRLLTSFTLTAAKSYVVLQADPCIWESGEKCGGIYSSPRVPFAQVQAPSSLCGVYEQSNPNAVSHVCAQTQSEASSSASLNTHASFQALGKHKCQRHRCIALHLTLCSHVVHPVTASALAPQMLRDCVALVLPVYS